MKKFIHRVLGISLLSILLVTGTRETSQAQDVTVSYQAFYDNLAPYGQWIYDPEYGNVWVPNEDGNFRPYGSRGHWAMTEYGNTWISEDPWGWAVYHYGRWTYNPYYGWVWIPGYEWAPAWVNWRFGGGYAGWAPMGPGMTVGVGYYAPDSWWVFVGPQYMYQPNCISYWRGPAYNTTYIRQTTIINNYYVDNSTRVRYNYGPRAEVVQQVTRRPVQVYRVSQLNRPGAPSVGRNTVSLYRPSVNRGSVNEARPRGVVQAPRSVGRGQAVSPATGGRQPEFRQQMQRTQPENRGGRQANPGGNDRVNRYDNRPDGRTQPGQTETREGRIQTDQEGRREGRIQSNQPDRQNVRTQPDGRESRTQPTKPFRQDTRTQPGQPDKWDTRTQSREPNRQEIRTQPSQPERKPQVQPNRYDNRMDRQGAQQGRTENRVQPTAPTHTNPPNRMDQAPRAPAQQARPGRSEGPQQGPGGRR